MVVFFNYYSNNFIIVLYIPGIEDISQLEVFISQNEVEIEVKMEGNLVETEGTVLVIQLSSNLSKTYIQLPER
jgi:HSP20 family molecular chaperone IbpA